MMRRNNANMGASKMRNQSLRNVTFLGASLLAMTAAAPAFADEAADADSAAGPAGTEIIVTGLRATYNNAQTTEAMIEQQAPLTTPLSMIDNLPGVSVQEGDAFGFDDWSTAFAIRGFQTNLDQQQVGITIDGLPNGGSNYGGGAKANRYIDSMNIGSVQVSQGTADIGSLSNEALGGTINFTSSDPIDNMRLRASASFGDFGAERFYGRFDTGALLDGQLRAWISASHQEASDWIGGSAQNWRDHCALKFKTEGTVRLTGYASWDNTHEDNYDQVYSAAQFAANPTTDGLTTDWYGIPYQDQAYRRAWSTLRKNFFSYLKGQTSFGNDIDLNAAVYYHKNNGRGDWVPQYVVDVTADGAGSPESELIGGTTVEGGSPLGRIYFVDSNGVALTPAEGCVGNITFPYGGTTDPNYDPDCYPAGAIGAQSYRHTHYAKDRLGVTADGTWTHSFGDVENRLRVGFWYEDTKRREWRDWHNVIDTTVGPDYAHPPYWEQYRRKYPQDTLKWYAQDEISFGPVTANFGIKQFINHIERNDVLGETSNVRIKSKSDVLLSGGLQVQPMDGLDFFAGYAENFKALTDTLLEYSDADFGSIEPETAENWEAGVRYNSRWIQASATWFKSKFSNQVIFVSNSTEAGNDYLSEGDGKFYNAGGIDSEGFELLANVTPLQGLNFYGSYTYTDATYRGTGNTILDGEQGVTPGNRVAGIAKNMWVLSANYSTGPIRLGVSGKYTGDRYVNADNSWIAENYFLTDAYIGLKLGALNELLKGVDLSLTVNNLTDESYLGGISGNYAWIGAPRTVVFTVTADF